MIIEYQTLIVGCLGFAGVILTLVVNAKLNRDQKTAELKREGNSVRHAILAELKALKLTYEDRASTSKKDQDWLVPARVSNDVYKTFLPRIGLLSSEEVDCVMKAYLLVGELPTRLMLISASPSNNQPREGYIHIGRGYIEVAVGIHKAFLPDIEAAIDKLSQNIS